MSMNFFEQQDVARRNTGRLVFLFALAVIVTIALVYFVIAGALVAGHQVGQQDTSHLIESEPEPDADGPSLWDWRVLLGVSAGVLAVVSLGSFYKISQLSAGGHVVAEMLGGKLLHHDTKDMHERKILNVVEEMAIASGTPVPPVYLMEEQGINAFAAGYSPGDAVIGVTRGCIELLSRDELQGVIAHEFSHILNGDMKLNIRLIGIINGILVVGLIGYYTMRAGLATSRGSRSGGNKKGGDPGLALVAIGAAVMAIGFIGTFFGNLIRAAVSRQREFLADASAVQFTRNPQGISGALMKIGGHHLGSRIEHSHAREVAHMMFSQGIAGMFATHPPLPDRIRRIDPGWDGRYPVPIPVDDRNEAEDRRAAAMAAKQEQGRERIESFAKAAMAITAVQMIGQPTPAHVSYAQRIIASIPQPIRDAAHEPYGARALIYAMLLNTDAASRRKQANCLAQREDREVTRLTAGLETAVRSLDADTRLPVIDLATASLRELSPKMYEQFRDNVHAFIHADDEVEPFEWALSHLLLHHLDQHFDKRKRPVVQYYALTALANPLSALLSTLAHMGHGSEEHARQAFGAGAAELDVPVTMLPASKSGLGLVDEALAALNTVAAQLKKKILLACAACIAADKTITIAEAEMFRAIASSLDCPIPPVLPGQPLV